MSKMVIYLMLAFLLVGCATSESAVQTAIAETEEAKPTETYTVIPTDTPMFIPSPTFTLAPSETPTVTSSPTETETPIPSNTPEPPPNLADLAITLEELIAHAEVFGNLWQVTTNEGVDCFLGLDDCYVVGFAGELGEPAFLQINDFDNFDGSSVISVVAKGHLSDRGEEIVIDPDDSFFNGEWLFKLNSGNGFVYGFPYDRFFILSMVQENSFMGDEDNIKLVRLLGHYQAMKLRELGYK